MSLPPDTGAAAADPAADAGSAVAAAERDEPLRGRARAALQALVGERSGSAPVDFRDGQAEAIEALVEHNRRVLVVQRTGWGKSAVYFVATALRRAEGAGPTLIVSPLLALMRDQIAAAQRAGIRAVSINSANAQDWGEVRSALDADQVDVLLISPERLNNPRFREESLPDLASRCGLLVVDEAHCISDWGHDFRPDYRRIATLLTDLPASTPVLATTATANERVTDDVADQLGQYGARQVQVLRGSLARASLRLGVLDLAEPQDRIAWLIDHLADLPGSGIVYTLTVAAAEDLAATLRRAGHEVASYTGRTDPEQRQELEAALRDNRVKALIATSALGMGFDKPDLGFVVHLGAPSSPVAYYQQVGRAGRATERADVILLPGSEDRRIWEYFASAAMPRQQDADAVVALLRDSDRPLSTAAIETRVDVRRTRLELLLKVLDVDGAVTRVTGGWIGTGAPWSYDAERYQRVAQTRTDEQRMMLDYLSTDGCRMAFLQRALDDPDAAECGRCDGCAGPWYTREIDDQARQLAAGDLARAGIVVEPRSAWPSGMDRLGVPVKGRIGADRTAEPGRALARLSDLGWGQRLREVLADDQEPPRAVVEAVVRVLADWDWAHRPAAVAAIPSRSRPQLVTGLADAICGLGRLRPLGSLDLVDGGPVGERGGNSAFRLAGVWGRIVVGEQMRGALAQFSGPVLLVDDLIDSRWTMTVAATALREAGADAVLPFALASQG